MYVLNIIETGQRLETSLWFLQTQTISITSSTQYTELVCNITIFWPKSNCGVVVCSQRL